MTAPYCIIMDGPPPMETTSHVGFVYHLFEPIDQHPELIVYTHDPLPAMHHQLPCLPSRSGRVQLAFYNKKAMGRWYPVASKAHVSDLVVSPKASQLATYIRQIGSPRIILFISHDPYLIMYTNRLLQRLPDLQAAIFFVDEPLGAADQSRDPVFRARVHRNLAQLVRRCQRRFVISTAFQEYYEQRFNLPFGLILPAVRDDHFEVFSRLPAPTDWSINSKLRVFVSGHIGPVHCASFECLARAFHRVAPRLGKPPKLICCGDSSPDLLLQWGFEPSQLEHLGWLGSRREVIQRAYESTCCFAPGTFTAKEHGHLSFSGRTADLLLAGAPILAHAPAQSGVVQHFRKHGLPLVCDRLDDEILAKCLLQVASMSLDERMLLRRRYHALVEQFHLLSQARMALLDSQDA